MKKGNNLLEKSVYLGPITFLAAAFTFAPLILTLISSVLTIGDFGELLPIFTLENYKSVFVGAYGKIFLRSFYYAVQTNILCILIGYPVAYCIVKYGGKWKTFLVFLLIVPEATSAIIRIYAFKTITGNTGIINSMLLNLDIISSPIKFMYTPYAVMFGLLYNMLPYMILPLYASLDGLNPALLEAAEDMGATPMRRFFRVILPLTKGGILAGTILVFVPSLGDYLVPALMGGSKVMMVGNLVAHKFTVAGDIPAGAAFAVVLTAILVLLLYIIIKKGGEDALEKII